MKRGKRKNRKTRSKLKASIAQELESGNQETYISFFALIRRAKRSISNGPNDA